MDGKLHPCAYFSGRLSQAERNCDMGNRELLALVMALQELASLAGGGRQAVHCVDRPQEPGLPSRIQMAKLLAGKVGSLSW